MSWWNDLSTLRNTSANGADGGPRRNPSFSSTRDNRPGSPDFHAHPSAVLPGSLNVSGMCGADEGMWLASQSDATSLWQTATSVGLSDQMGLSENSPMWSSQPHIAPASRSGDAYVALPAASGKGMLGEAVRPVSGGHHSRSSYTDTTTTSTSVNTTTTAATAAAAAVGGAGGNRPVTGQRSPPRTRNDDPHRRFGPNAAVDESGTATDDDDDDGSLYDEVDVGTISSLIASLQIRTGQPETDADDVAGAATTLRSSHRDTPTLGQSMPLGTPLIMVDPAASAASGPRSLPSHADSRSLFAEPSLSLRDGGGGDLNGSRGGSGGGDGNPSSPHPPSASIGGGGQRADASAIAPLHLTPSMLEGLLANFQTALRGRSGEASATTPVPQVADTELSQPDRYGSPYGQEELAGATSRASPLMRSHVSSVVAHKLNIDASARGTPVQDFRRGLAASMSSSCSDPSTPVRQRGTSAPGRKGMSSNAFPHERAASPDSSIDRFFSQTTPLPMSSPFASVRQTLSASAMDDNNAVARPHMRTASEISLPAAAATYTGATALHQHVDERGCITVVDPQRRKLHVPFSAIQTTKALNGRLKTPSLCLLFQSGRCRQGDNCYQVHIDPATVDRLRADVESMPCCCLLHGDCNSHLIDTSLYEGRSLCVAGQYTVPFTRVAYTAGLQRVLQEEAPSVAVNPSVLCRLHGQPGGCRFGADCKFLHVCCAILQGELAPLMATTASSATVSTPTQSMMQPHTGPAAPNSPATFVHSHTSSAMGLPGSAGTAPLPGSASSPSIVPRSALAMNSANGCTAAEVRLSPPLSMQMAQPLPSSTGSPQLQELRATGSGQIMGAANGMTGAALYNRNYVSTPRQNAGTNLYTSAGPISKPSMTPSTTHHTANSLTASGNFAPMQLAQAGTAQPPPPSGQYFTVTTVQQSRNSPAQTPVVRPAVPMQSTSAPESPQSGYHVRTFSAPGTGSPYVAYGGPAVVRTPNRSGAGSPMSMGLPATRSSPNIVTAAAATGGGGNGGLSSGYSSPMQRHLPPQSNTPPQASHLQQQPQHQRVTSQQLYVQQINQDGTMTFVPVNVVPNLGA